MTAGGAPLLPSGGLSRTFNQRFTGSVFQLPGDKRRRREERGEEEKRRDEEEERQQTGRNILCSVFVNVSVTSSQLKSEFYL